jgi:hypothetical protein
MRAYRGDDPVATTGLFGMMLTRISFSAVLGLALTGCAETTAPVPNAGHRFVLESVGGSPLPIQSGPNIRQIADTLSFLPSTLNERVVEHRSVYELSGELQQSVFQEVWRVKNADVLEWRCPINALCTFAVKEARVRAGQLEITYPGSDLPAEVYRRVS